MLAARPSTTSDAIIYLPGIMGSELVDATGTVVWGMKPSLLFRQAVLGDALARLRLRPDDEIRPSRVLQFPVALPVLSSMEPYRFLEQALKRTAVRPEAVVAFAYDWRRSIRDAAAKLAPVVREHFAQWQRQWALLPDDEKQGLAKPRVTLVGHSMGGLVASYFTAFLDHDELVGKVVTLGTPFAGSLNALEVLATGSRFPFDAFCTQLRELARTLPGLYELVARWKCVADGEALRRLAPEDLESVGASRELAERAAESTAELATAIAGDAGRRPPLRCLVGTTQPTLQSVTLLGGSAEFAEQIDGTDHRGDGTVFRYAAFPDGVQPAYLPQSHGALAKKKEAVEYVVAVLTERELGAFLAPAGVGLRVPQMAKAGQALDAEILDGEPGMICQLHDAESDQLLTMAQAQPRDDRLVATLRLRRAGLYRVTAAGGGLSPVEQLVVAMDEG